jgi:hypothetical protein
MNPAHKRRLHSIPANIPIFFVMSPVGVSASDPGYSMRVLLPSNAGIALEKLYFFGLTAQIKVIPTALSIKTK